MTEPRPAADREASEHLRVLQRQLARLPLAYGVFDSFTPRADGPPASLAEVS